MIEKQALLMQVLAETPPYIFKQAIKGYRLQSIYSYQRKFHVYKYFDGDLLRWSVTMRDIFNEFQTIEQEMRSEQIEHEVKRLKQQIGNYRRFRLDTRPLVERYNALAREKKELDAGIRKLIRLYKKVLKDQQAKKEEEPSPDRS